MVLAVLVVLISLLDHQRDFPFLFLLEKLLESNALFLQSGKLEYIDVAVET